MKSSTQLRHLSLRSVASASMIKSIDQVRLGAAGSEMAYLRQSLRAETSASASRRILMICSSENASSWGCPHIAYEDIINIAVY